MIAGRINSATKEFETIYDSNASKTINIKLLNEYAKTPTCGSLEAAGYDLYAAIDEQKRILPHEIVKIGTGIAMEIPSGYFGAVYARSGLATKRGLRPANCTGIIDSDYRGEIIVAIRNDTGHTQIIEPGERIAQLIIQPYLNVAFNEVDELTDTIRGSSGFGDSGKF